jgi:thiol-disulfide isomerase/thioredoxin
MHIRCTPRTANKASKARKMRTFQPPPPNLHRHPLRTIPIKKTPANQGVLRTTAAEFNRHAAISSDDSRSVVGRASQGLLGAVSWASRLGLFWAPWCAPCIQQEPELAKINRELRAKNTGTVVLVSTYSSLAETRRMVRRDRLSVPILSANPTEPEGRAFYRAFLGSQSPLPVTFVVDAASRVVGYTEGRADLAHLRALLNRAEG